MPKPGLRPTKAASNQGLSTAALTELVGSAVISRMPVNFFSQLIVVGFILCAYQVHTADFKPAAQDSIVSKGAKVEFLWGEGEFTEGPTLGPNGVIYFSDIGNRTLKFNPRTKKTTVFRADSGKSNGLMMDRKGNLIACEGANGGRRRISVTSSSGKTRVLADRWKGKRFNSPNDLAIDEKDRVYFTDPRYVGDEPREIDFEGVFLVGRDGAVKVATRQLQKPNGILVSLDGKRVYVADNNNDPKGNHHLTAFDVKANGTLVNKRVLHDFGPDRRGVDGMTMDAKGNIYATAGRDKNAGIYVFSPNGKHLAFIPTTQPTNCVFGDDREKNTLYITAIVPKKEGGPTRWGLYRINLKVEGHHIFPLNKL